MGYFSELMIERYNDYVTDALAEHWGIDYYELAKYEYDLIENQSKDGLITGFTVNFHRDVPKEFLTRIPGVDDRKVKVDASVIIDAEPYEYEFEAITETSKLLDNFEKEIVNLRRLNNLDLGNKDLEVILRRQVYIAAITTMETFLSETFVKVVTNSELFMEKFVRSHPAFKDRKFTLDQIYDKYNSIGDIAKKTMLETIYHDLVKVRMMYSTTLDITFPFIGDVMRCVKVRHDLVHRNGKSNEGDVHTIDKATVENTIKIVEKLVADLAETMGLFIMPF
ncbi:hypothetical protein [Sphingobacterium multivorum]|uniref:RiboL-PSP-HEPN domain-containing protein n=1 Tax=Sphingobacterium multivorum TaxID=28454 RepID=A0A2X2L2S4_SPHMU|nr:hypothetical protein [Sphingobacterium multivorum]QRQ59798.1 hypothetical protein I6J33_16680 [Sphingobacterium multivorum]SPZ83570.1 Uncharacterised protein [Sphingobacterium multivorum]